MAKKENAAKKDKKRKSGFQKFIGFIKWFLIIGVSLILSGAILMMLGDFIDLPFNMPTYDELAYFLSGQNVASEPEQVSQSDFMTVHFLDLGQADCTLVRYKNKTMLVDAGESSDGPKVVAYLKRQGVEKIDIVVGTHPHADHIGGLSHVVENMNVDSVVLPRIPENITPTTRAYTDLLEAMRKKDIRVTEGVAGKSFEFEGGYVTIASPKQQYNDLNNNSVVLRVTLGARAFLITGDSEKAAEADIVSDKPDIKSDVLKVSHHGSSTSTTEDFLKLVLPQYAVIQVGADNTYGHPTREVIERLEAYGVQILRTDFNGDIVFKTDGTSLEVKVER